MKFTSYKIYNSGLSYLRILERIHNVVKLINNVVECGKKWENLFIFET